MDSTLTLISLADTRLHAPLISHELFLLLEQASSRKEKVALLYNRRGLGRAWICQDCGYYPPCPHCDIALAYHTTPHRTLLCHQCSHTMPIIVECPSCRGSRFDAVGIGIQKIESDLKRLFPLAHIERIDSDRDEKKSELAALMNHTDILITTYTAVGLLQHFDHIVFLQFESDLTLPDYRMEEDTFHVIDYAKKLEKNILIQTRLDKHPLLDVIFSGNYKDFLTYMSQERKMFHYPPYTDFACIWVHDRSQDRVRDIVSKLASKLLGIKDDDQFLAYDRDIWEKRRGEWVQKIILKGKNIPILLESVRMEILKNRGITLEWR